MRAYRPIADRRRQLIDAGIAIGEREGVAAVTARRVASEAGVSLGLVSYCFATKDDLTVAMAARIAEDTAEAADFPLDLSPPPIPELVPAGARSAEATPRATPGVRSTAERSAELEHALQEALGRLWALHEATPGRQLLTYEITTRALREPRLNDVAQQQYDTTVRTCGAVLAHVADQVGVAWDREIDEIASLVVMAIDGATLRWLVDKDSAAALRRLGDVARMLVTMAR
ncbi:TetR/AcrR family transcriptional regulator [Kineosporia babensis]|uniref:TetR family transcriptional regulator n=1 Tax=Kineosporia babensis TaxID=499548 RepID=A0A9X1NAF9_9ACTN|nr:TetR family transcriptional regulator C-terminal domain-containing protein [Kineosporia babensis]MCD5309423.1 TetR family transcriptional regulator [Kineosporia babensis]